MANLPELKAQLRTLRELRDEGVIDAPTYDRRSEPLLAEIEKLSRERADGVSDPYAQPQPQPQPLIKQTRLVDLRAEDVLTGGERRFRLIERIGSGGMGDVWKASAESDGGETVALKLLEPGRGAKETDIERLREEAQRARRLSHPNIVNVFGWHRDRNGILFLEMEYLTGRSLDRVLREQGQPGLRLAQVLAWLKPAAEAIDWAYRKHGLVHRDLKPGNLFLGDDGEIKVLDFGISAVARGTSAGTVVMQDSAGTDEYLAPECRRAHKLKPQQDVYALAVTLYELLTRECPWPGRMAMLRMPERIDSDWPEPPDGLGDGHWAVLKDALAYEAALRPENCTALLAKLAGAASAANGGGHEQRPTAAEAAPTGGGANGLPHIERIHGWRAERVQALQAQTAQALGLGVAYRDCLSDGSEGPELVVIPAGRFKMGSPEGEAERNEVEGPQHEVEIGRAFGLGRYAVSFDEYLAYCRATGAPEPSDEGWGRGKHPVINVSWTDATEYAAWLSAETGKRYRLPTEAEWEYAARAGTVGPFGFEGPISVAKANYNGDDQYAGSAKGEYRERTVAVDELAPNRWGLYQMHGNVWEWTCSEWDTVAYQKGSKGAHTRCATTAAGARALRGGSWSDAPWWLRSAPRGVLTAGGRNFDVGFRLAQDL